MGKKAILIKSNYLNYKLSSENLSKILELKKGMNYGRTKVDNNLLPDGPINPHWLVGFCEGDSSFCLRVSNLMPIFLIPQNKKVLK